MENRKYWWVFKEGLIGSGTECDSMEEAEIIADKFTHESPGVDVDVLESKITFCSSIIVDRVNHFSDKEE